MSSKPEALLGLIALLVPLVCAASALAEESPAQGQPPQILEKFIATYCVRCHGPEKSKGELALHSLHRGFSNANDAEQWARVLNVLEAGAMPPEDEAKQPTAAERATIVQWLRTGLAQQEQQASEKPSVAAPTARRLTNFEYQNTMRDLLGFELNLAERLPKDPVKPYHFNNTAELMLMGPEQFDLYLECARRAMASAIVEPEKPKTFKTREEWKADAVQGRLPNREISVWPGGRGNASLGMSIKEFPKTGEFRVRCAAAAILTPGAKEIPLRFVIGQACFTENSSTLIIEPIGTARLRNGADEPQILEFRGRIENCTPQSRKSKSGDPLPSILTITPQNLYDDGTLNDDNNFQKTRRDAMPRAVLDWMEFEAPIIDVWPPEHHTRIMFESPLRESDPLTYVREVLKKFMLRAFRRPAREEEVASFTKIYDTLLPELKTSEAAMRETLSLVLVSPQFLFHTEDGSKPGANRQYELASRLSYFLWGTMPHDELFTLAAQNKLDDPAVLAAQAERLLADTRAKDFVRNFTSQWLSLDKMRTVPINRDLFPRFLYYVPLGERAGTEEPYRPTIRDYMLEETFAFVGELIHTNDSVLKIVDSDFACLNQPLAAHYGVADVHGDEIRRVPVNPEHHLGGLLTHGSVLIGNGTGSAPHPIYRAVWLREAILGDEVPPPPADVPALSDSAGESAETAVTIKDLLALHRQKESCNDCHSRLDPWGIPFEHYNAIGKFQPLVPKNGTKVSPFSAAKHTDLTGYEAYLKSICTVPIQADARVPLGPTVNGMDELKAYLLQSKRDAIATNVMRRLTAYALGRELTWRDRFMIEELVKKTQPGGYKLRDMIVAICQSAAFRTPTR
jgi:mono/diheme cytochrome c family protein